MACAVTPEIRGYRSGPGAVVRTFGPACIAARRGTRCERTGPDLLIPELKRARYDEYYRTFGVVAEALAHRIGHAPADFEVRVFAGAVIGALLAAFDSAPKTADTIYRALEFLDAGMPLS